MKQLKIGKLKLENPLILAPMVDVTDLPYRLICRKAGAALAFTEMIYVDALLHENKKTKMLAKTIPSEKPVGLQITGDRESEFEKFLEREELWKDYDLIDLNCGCPSLRVAKKSGAGSFLMRGPEKIGRFVRILKKTGKPVTVKVRLGFEKNNVLEVAKVVEEAGADALTVHGRLATEGGRVRANWEWIRKVKEIVKIPVIGNGDVVDGKSASELLKLCDGVMIARAAIGDPLIFARILDYLETGGKVPTHPPEISKGISAGGKGDDGPDAGSRDNVGGLAADVLGNLKLFLEYLKLQRKYYGKEVDLSRVKYVGGRFLKGMRRAARLREKFYGLKTLREAEEFVGKLV